jgi:hypothetical protein
MHARSAKGFVPDKTEPETGAWRRPARLRHKGLCMAVLNAITLDELLA